MDEERGGVLQMPEVESSPGGLTPERLASLLAYCKLTELAEDPEVQVLIPLMYAGAVEYMRGAGIDAPDSDASRAALYDLCVNYMVANAWDCRDVSAASSTASDNLAFRRYFNQLKHDHGGGYG